MSTTETSKTASHAAYWSWMAAEDEWTAELRRLFGWEGYLSARYSSEGEGEPGSHLRTLYDSWKGGRDAWHESLRS